MASINVRPTKAGEQSWRVMYRIGGRQVGDSFATHKDALAHQRLIEQIGGASARLVLDERSAVAGLGRTITTLDDWLEHHLQHLTGATPGTVADYRRLAARTWGPTLGPLPIQSVSADLVRRWVGEQAARISKRGTPTSAKTIANAHGLLSSVLAAAVSAELIPANKAAGVALPRGQREEITWLTEAEFARLLAVVPPYWHPLVVTLAGTGMRWGEATALRWADTDLNAAHPYVRVTRAWKKGATQRVLGAPKTRRSRRTITLPEQVITALRPLQGKPDDLVFRGPRGGQVHHQAFHPRVWQRAVRDAQLGKTPRIHDLRHSHASWLLQATNNLHLVQLRLGHESITTTVDVYGHLAADAGPVAAAAITLALDAAMPAIVG